MAQKYKPDLGIASEDVKVLYCIANEIAEANRLKRLELYADGKLETTDMDDFDVGKERIQSGSKLGVRK
tara:strand:+ start:592 stop:798 length:207 start_codon:yes stop_codon:yes gene_type:complete